MTAGLTARLVVAAVVPQLNGADVTIQIEADSAFVEARYEFEQVQDSLTFFVIKLRGQQLEFIADDEQSQYLTAFGLSGMYSLSVARQRSDSHQITLRYRITGEISRIPIAVSDVPFESGSVGVHIAVRGVSPNASLRDGFPRLSWASDGSAMLDLDNLPSFVRLPPSQGEWSANWIADLAVVLLVLVSSLYWLYRRRSRVGQVR